MFIPVVQPVLLVASGAAQFWYLRQVRHLATPWPKHRGVLFSAGLLAVLAATSGPLNTLARQSFSTYVTQQLGLLLLLPILIVAGQPFELAERAHSGLARLRAGGGARALYSPVVGAAVVPVVCVALLFGPVPGLAVREQPIGWLVQLAAVLAGIAVALPLIGTDTTIGSLAVGGAVAIGIVELLVDAVPGIVMRLSTHPVSDYFRYRAPTAGQWPWLRDQQVAGAILWTMAELLDVPFLILVFRKWVAADAREAAVADKAAEDVLTGPERPGGTEDRPWFLDDPRLKDRFR